MALKGINAYKKGSLKQDIANADPHKITLMLMQGALDRMAYAKGNMERKDFESKAENLSRVTAIFVSLRDSLDMKSGGEISDNLFSLYDYMIQRVIDANVQNSLLIMDEVTNLLLPIKNAWAQIPEAAKQEAYAIQRQNQQAAM
ncbi:flagellar export chaperone FliS [Alteromonadaceae bacterium BrNp21-10]|nr:flagellar export chaperone FliS [Alteromonadaceae bacterium BrNp21-10]